MGVWVLGVVRWISALGSFVLAMYRCTDVYSPFFTDANFRFHIL